VHELGALIEVVKTVEAFAAEHSVARIDSLVLQIGELSPIVPAYVEACYPAAVDGSLLQDTRLRIEILPGNGRCAGCGKVFNLIRSERSCPSCGGRDWELLGGKEFLIKEIVAC
jgi:hydrogenase nickel incorporation protein HypA/HybF